MIIRLQTIVEEHLPKVWERFDLDLLKTLSPPFPPVKVLRYDGNLTGDTVSFELNVLGLKQRWTSAITDHQIQEDQCYFVDEGTELPFFLKKWRHVHRMERRPNGTLIDDHIEFSTPFFLFDYLMYPVLWAQFAYRKPIYRRYFRLTSTAGE